MSRRIGELRELLKALYDGLYTNAQKMSRLIMSADDDAETDRKLERMQHEQFALAQKICDAQEELEGLGSTVQLRPGLARFARKQQEWIKTVGRAQ